MAGIKRKEYLLYLANVRAEEQQAYDRGDCITRKSIEEIREEFQAKYGSIWMEIYKCKNDKMQQFV